MPTRSSIWAGLLGVTIATALCGCPTKEPENIASAEVKPDPPKAKPKPKCEDLAEKCTATADTQARIASADSVFIPPEGWIYAQQSEMTVANKDGTPGTMGITAYDGEGKEAAKARDAAYDKLVSGLSITVPEKAKKKYVPRWDKADATRKSGNADILLWQAEGAKRDGKDGFLIVILTSDPAGKKILGVAFSADEDTATAVSKALETIGPGSYQ